MKRATNILAAGLVLASCAVPSTGISSTPPANASVGPIKGVRHIGITVSDIDEAIAFYSAAVPYEVVDRELVPASDFPDDVMTKREGNVEIALIRTPTVFIQLLDIEPDQAAPPERRPVIGPGYTHICFQSPSTAPKFDVFKENGLDILSRGGQPVDLGGYGVTYAYGFDPDGTMIEMEQLTPAVIAAHGELGKKRSQHPAWPTHIANVTGDKERMVEFYSGVLGYGPRRELPPTKRATFDEVVDIDNIEISASWFEAGNFELEFWQYHQPATPLGYTGRMVDTIGYNSVAFEVTDLNGTVARLEQEGVSFAGDAFELGGWIIRYARDPEGNLLAFQQRTTAPADRSIDDMLWLKDRAPAE